MSDFHLKADLPADPDERITVMADAFKIALTHAATDPETRVRMILGEAYTRLNGVVEWLRLELLKENAEVNLVAKRLDLQPELLTRKIGEPDVAATQQKLLALALHRRDSADE